MSIHNGIVIIPVLNPGYNLINLVRVIKQSGFEYVVIVNDGSSEEYNDIFAEVSKQQGVTILRHCVNLGKGRALKTAINFVINEYPKCVGVITVDADGQHTIKDIQAMNKALLQYQGENKIILGCRTFEDTDELKVPLRSKIGNVCTKYIMRYLCNLKVSDTQTGLRAIPRQYLPKLVETAGERYEYETNMLLQLTTGGAQITEIPINTVYEGQNEVSHFHPLRDSWMIYKTIIAYSLSSMLSVVVDNLLFIVLLPYINNVWILTFIGRAAAALVNFTVNRNVVFKKRDHVWNTFLKYILLVLLSGTVSAFAVSKISSWMGDISIIVKICVESVLYFFNYYIQKNFVFIKKQNREDGA